MMATFDASYQQFGVDDNEDTPQGSGVMIHEVPEGGRASRWNHIEDLDNFFSRVYMYHQKHGFSCMMLQEILELFQFIFVVFFSFFLFNCVDYPLLFKDKVNNATASQKMSISDVLYPAHECVSHLGFGDWTVIIVAIIFWLLRALKVIYHLFQYWDVKAFFNTALKINDNDLDNVTWHEVQKRLREVQQEQQMCIHKKDLSELDIYHRILRFKNYLVAMVNKNLLPPKFHLPFIGEVVYLSHGLKYNIEFLLFWGPWSPFENNWHLKEDYKKVSKRHELASILSKQMFYLALVNLILCPLILLWQILYSFFSYAEVVKREPGSLGIRCWSLFGRLYLRHFNELDHELNARLNRAYRPASKYMNIFTSPLLTVIAKNVAFVAGAVLAVLIALTVYDEDVLTVEHVFTLITILGAIVASFRVLIPDEHLVWWPEHLMNAILAQVHYLPSHWRGNAHTLTVRQQFSQLFQYRATYLLTELVSPIVTPIVLLCHLRPKALEIVDFYRSFTVQVAGVGDVCAFAQMDIRTYGDPSWRDQEQAGGPRPPRPPPQPSHYVQAEEGKTELSLMHFKQTNPEWTPPAQEAEDFLAQIRQQAQRHFQQVTQSPVVLGPESVATAAGLPPFVPDQSLSSVAAGLSSLLPRIGVADSARHGMSSSNIMINVSHNEGPVPDAHRPQLSSGMCAPSLGASVFGQEVQLGADPAEFAALDMSLSALYLHHVHHRALERRGTRVVPSSAPTTSGSERLPLLHSPTHPHVL